MYLKKGLEKFMDNQKYYLKLCSALQSPVM